MEQSKQTILWRSLLLLSLVFGIYLSFTAIVYAQVTIVNMIPASLSNEDNQDSEPNVAVNPNNPNRIAASAFTPGHGFCPENTAPIYVSTNHGDSWNLICNLPSGVSKTTKDISVAFSTMGDTLYAGILRDPDCDDGESNMSILRSVDFTSPSVMEILAERCNVDQPYVEAISREGLDQVFVGSNDKSLSEETRVPRTAVIDQSMNANPAPPFRAIFTRVLIERRDAYIQDAPSIRTALHPDGTVYSMFFRIKDANEPAWMFTNWTGDITVVRDDNAGTSADPFTDLREPAPPDGDGLPGFRVVQDISVPHSRFDGFGNERLGSRLSIAVDPRNSSTVYIAWVEGSWAARRWISTLTMHLRQSLDRGRTWSEDLRVIEHAINPALAVDSNGKVGLLYQKLRGYGTDHPRWETRLEIFNAVDIRIRRDILLANVPADRPRPQMWPYLGDYLDLMAVGTTFYGVFSANNTPDRSNFPVGDVVYQRHADFTTHTLYADEEHTTEVLVSIDPFFFKVTEPFSLNYCVLNPSFCDSAPEMEEDRLYLRCRKLRDCLVIDYISKNCQVKYGSCPGCEPGRPCPPYYHIFLDNITDAWSVTVVDENLKAVKHQQFKTDTGLVISFRPDKDKFIDGQIGNYRLVFQMNRTGEVGKKYEIKTRVKASNMHYKPK